MKRQQSLEKVIVPVVGGLGLQWVGLRYFPQGAHTLLQVFVEKTNGVTVDDCARASRQINAVLSVEGMADEDYVLEVSSPGLDRFLFSPEQCHEQIGQLVSVRLHVARAGRKNFKGNLQRVDGADVFVRVDEEEEQFSFSDIDEIRLVPGCGHKPLKGLKSEAE